MKPEATRFYVVPHTHWDREWYRPFEHFRLLLGGVVDEVLDTLERDPAFTSFTLDGQAIVLEDYVAVRPENEGRLRALIAAGRIEIGPSYMLPDEFLVGGEPLIRNLLIGRAVCERFGGRTSPAGYLPDSFGHPLQLPQILAGFGIESFLFSRGLGDQLDDVGIAFQWVAPDGSSVRALQLLADYGNFADISDPDDAEARVNGLLERFGPYLERAGAREVVLCNGTDHWRVQPQMPAVCAELERRFPGASFRIAQYGQYVEELHTGELPSYTGELLGSRLNNVLRGVNSARLYLKQANEHAEQQLRAVETLAALVALQTHAPFPHSDFTLAWKELLKCQPHDSICGCSCDEVHRDMLVRYESLQRTLQHLGATALAALGDTDAPAPPGDISVFNPLPFARRQLIATPGSTPTLVELDGFEARTIALTTAHRAPTPQTGDRIGTGDWIQTGDRIRTGDRIESDRIAVQAAPDGTLTIEHKRSGRRFTNMHAIEHELDMGDLYNFCPVDGYGTWRSTEATTRILADGPVLSELQITYNGEIPAGLDHDNGHASLSLSTVVRLTQGSDRVEFETTIDNAAEDHRLRAIFPAGHGVQDAVRAEGQFAVVTRRCAPPPPRTDWVDPPDPTGHAIGAVALGPLALLTRGLPEYEARGGSELCLTLLRCVGLISRESKQIATRPHGAGPQTPTPEGQCPGRHVLHYAVRLDADELDDAALLRESQDYRQPFLALPAGIAFEPPLTLSGDVMFSCLKGAENGNGLVLRVFNPATSTAGASVAGPVTLERIRLDESNGQSLTDGTFDVRPGEIASLRLRHQIA